MRRRRKIRRGKKHSTDQTKENERRRQKFEGAG